MTAPPKKQKGDLRILFWNVQDWRLSDPAHFDRIMGVLRREKPDIALFAEVSDPTLKTRIVQSLKSAHVAFETTDKTPRHLMAVFNAAATGPATVEQRNEFSDDTLTVRTFPLLRLHGRHGPLAILAAHAKSGSTNENMTKRSRQFGQLARLGADLAAQDTPLLVMGDLNTMGNSGVVNSAREIAIMARIVEQGGLSILPKDKTTTWHGVGPDARFADCDLDHALASAAIATRASTVRVGGWPTLRSARGRDNWVRRYSDHAYLVVDIKPPAP